MLEKDFVNGMKVKVNTIKGYETLNSSIVDWENRSETYPNDLRDLKSINENGGYLFGNNKIYYVVYSNKDKNGRFFYVDLKDVEPYEELIEKSLLDKVFQVHNEITLRNGEAYICVGDKYLYSNEEGYIEIVEYDEKLKHKYESNYDIMKVVNPFTQEVIYEREKEIDWNSVEVNTPVLLRNSENEEWIERKFALYLPNAVKGYKFIAFTDNKTKENADDIIAYRYCKLVK